MGLNSRQRQLYTRLAPAHLQVILGRCRPGVVVLGLDGARVNAPLVQGRPNLRRDGHEIAVTGGRDVDRCHQLGLRQLPDVELVQGEYTIDIKDRSAYLLQGHRCWYTL